MNERQERSFFRSSFIVYRFFRNNRNEGGGLARVSAWKEGGSRSRWTAPRKDRLRDRRTGGRGTTRAGRGRSLRWERTSQRPIPPRTSITYRNEKRITRNSWFNPPSRSPSPSPLPHRMGERGG